MHRCYLLLLLTLLAGCGGGSRPAPRPVAGADKSVPAEVSGDPASAMRPSPKR